MIILDKQIVEMRYLTLFMLKMKLKSLWPVGAS
jgi:hypothetical protein